MKQFIAGHEILVRRAITVSFCVSIFWESFFPSQNWLTYGLNTAIMLALYILLLLLHAGFDLFLRAFGWILLGAGVMLTLNMAVGEYPTEGWPTPVRLGVYTLLVCFYLFFMRGIRLADKNPFRYLIG